MKKLVTLLLILCLLLPAASPAEELLAQLDALSDDQLLTVNNIIQRMLFKRIAAVNGALVPSGEYVVGEDIPAGTYRIVYTPKDEYSFCSFLAVNEKESFGFTTILGFDSSTEIGKLKLSEGTNISLTGGDVTFYTYTGLFN